MSNSIFFILVLIGIHVVDTCDPVLGFTLMFLGLIISEKIDTLHHELWLAEIRAKFASQT